MKWIKPNELPLTAVLVLLLILVFCCEIKFSVADVFQLKPRLATLTALGGMNIDVIRNTGEIYRLFTAAWLNESVMYLVFNCAALLVIGLTIEKLSGGFWLFSCLIASIVCGGILSYAFLPNDKTCAGTSGAIVGLGMALFIRTFAMPPEMRDRCQIRCLYTLILLLMPLIVSVRHHFDIDYGSYIGGAVGGTVLGWLEKDKAKCSARTFTALGAVLLIVSVPFVVVEYPKYKRVLWLIPAEEFPATRAEGIAIAPKLIEQYPLDPRSHEMQSWRLFDMGDRTRERVELVTALQDAMSLHWAFGTRYENHLKDSIQSIDSEQR